MSDVPKEIPTPPPTAIMLEVSGQIFASVVDDGHMVFAAAPIVCIVRECEMMMILLETALLEEIIVFVMSAAWVGSPIAEVVLDNTAVLLQQFVLVSPASRQQKMSKTHIKTFQY